MGLEDVGCELGVNVLGVAELGMDVGGDEVGSDVGISSRLLCE